MLASVLSYLRAGGLFLLAATLTACGGGGGGGGFISTPIGGDTSATTYSLSIETLNPAGEASLQLTSEAPLTVNVSLLGSDGSTPSNELITLTTNVASIDPANGGVQDRVLGRWADREARRELQRNRAVGSHSRQRHNRLHPDARRAEKRCSYGEAAQQHPQGTTEGTLACSTSRRSCTSDAVAPLRGELLSPI